MSVILGIDLGTTNSVVSILRDGQPVVIGDEQGRRVLPSVVGFDSDGNLLVGETARNQALLAPQRTVKSIKRHMGEATRVKLGEQEFTPQEISAMILRTLKQWAERELNEPVTKAVITVPAFFNENQREATRMAGELAGLEVVRIVNEPTAAVLTYEPHSTRNEKLLVYDLGGGTFDVSIVQTEMDVVEVLASRGDTHLGGDDFDQLLLDHVCNAFETEHGIDLRQIPTARSRLLQSVEAAKIRLSSEPFATVAEEFIADKNGAPLNLNIEIDRSDYEAMIASLLAKTIECVDVALSDAKLSAVQLDRVILVGGSSRTPLVRRLLIEQLGHEPLVSVDPDLCVSMGAAVQGGLISGDQVRQVLVDITPRTLGIACLEGPPETSGKLIFSPIIHRNSPLPASRSEVYCTARRGQAAARIDVYQGEHEDIRFNQEIGSFNLENLDTQADEGSEILVRFDMNHDGILNVTAIERATGNERRLTINNALSRFDSSDRGQAKSRLSEIFDDNALGELVVAADETLETNSAASTPLLAEAGSLLDKARELLKEAAAEDAEEMRMLIEQLEHAALVGDRESVDDVRHKLEDILFYLEDA